jgi:hypothetical protein
MNGKIVFLINHAPETSLPLLALAREYGPARAALLFESRLAFNLFNKEIGALDFQIIDINSDDATKKKEEKLSAFVSRRIVYPEVDRINWWFGKLGPLKQVFRRQFVNLERDFWVYVDSAARGLFALLEGFQGVLIYEPPSTTLINYLISDERFQQLHIVGIRSSRVSGKMEIHSSKFSFIDRFRSSYERAITSEASLSAQSKSYAATVGKTPPEYFQVNKSKNKSVSSQLRKLFDLKRIFLYFRNSFADNAKSFQVGRLWLTTMGWFLNNLMTRVSRKWVCVVYAGVANRYSGSNYYVFPMHVHPEASTSVEAFGWMDDEALVKNIRNCIPIGCDLIVREHPNAIGSRGASFYKKIGSIPNVYVDFGSDVYALTSSSMGVITLGGTLGYEAAVRGFPVFNLVASFYNVSENVVFCPNLYELSRKIVDRAHLRLVEDERLARCYFDECSEGDIFRDINAVSSLKESLEKKFNIL